MKTPMVVTTMVFDAEFQIVIELPLEIPKEEALATLREHYHEILRGVLVHKPTISKVFDVPYKFVYARGLVDDVNLNDMRVDTYREDRA